jgi:predicted nucleic-acid-binding Zn-ribbon protein
VSKFKVFVNPNKNYTHLRCLHCGWIDEGNSDFEYTEQSPYDKNLIHSVQNTICPKCNTDNLIREEIKQDV